MSSRAGSSSIPVSGFAKTAEHDWALLAHLSEFVDLGFPVLIGASRKSFLGRLLAAPDGTPRPVGERESATLAITTYAALHGAWGVRVHSVGPNVDAAATVAAITHGADASTRRPDVTDRIALTGLRVRGHHGVYEFERREGQDFVVDVGLDLDTAPAAASDDVADTVHYGELAESLAAVVAGEPVNLLETLAAAPRRRLPGRCASACRRDNRAQAAGADRADVRRRGRHHPARTRMTRDRKAAS